MVMRVATFANNTRMLNAALLTQARMADLQMQEASGVVSTDYSGLGAATRTVLDLEASLKASQAYGDATEEAASRVEVLSSTLSTITDMMSEFRSQLTSMMSADSNDTSAAALSTAAEGYMDELASLLNTSYEGRYLFGGDRTTTAPVDLDGYVADADTVSTAYYQGDGAVATVKISRDQSVAYGVTAGNSAFEQAFRALGMIASATDATDTDLLQSSYDLMVSALDATIAVQSKVSIDAGTLERATSRQSDYESFLSAAVTDLKGADVTQIAVTLSSYETQLSASYSALAKVQSLNLLDYLR